MTRAGERLWASPCAGGSTSYWLRSVATRTIGSWSMSRAVSTSQRRDAGSARCTSSTVISSGACSAYARSTRRSPAPVARSSPSPAGSANPGMWQNSCWTAAKGIAESPAEQRARSTCMPWATASSAAFSRTVVRPVPVAPRSRTRRPVPAWARSIVVASSRAASRSGHAGRDIPASLCRRECPHSRGRTAPDIGGVTHTVRRTTMIAHRREGPGTSHRPHVPLSWFRAADLVVRVVVVHDCAGHERHTR